MKVLTVKMPAFLASALINGDTSGLKCSCGAKDTCAKCGGRHAGDCDFRWLAEALYYCAPGHVAGTACSCGEEESPSEEGEHAPGCGEPYFSWTCELPGWHLGADMLDYTVIYPEG